MYRSKNGKTAGFTLVELSIVIIIIGLLIAGIAGGASLIKQTQLNSIITDIQNFTMAHKSFKAKYGAIAGDFNQGYAYWGSTGQCTDDFVETVHTGCNGDGNGKVDNSDSYEAMLYWKHLSFAGYLSQKFPVTLGLTGAVGVDFPASKIDGAGYYITYDTYWGAVPEQHMFLLGKEVLGAGTTPYGAVLTPAEAWSIDNKMDDGLPASGHVISGTAPVYGNGHCSNGTGGEDLSGATAYASDNPSVACRMAFLISSE